MLWAYEDVVELRADHCKLSNFENFELSSLWARAAKEGFTSGWVGGGYIFLTKRISQKEKHIKTIPRHWTINQAKAHISAAGYDLKVTSGWKE